MKKSADMAVSTPLKENTNLKAALGYVRLLGWKLFPVNSIIDGICTCGKHNCNSPGKHPAINNGVKGATDDEQKIIEYWTNRPYLNIGVATGQASGFFVLDIDNKLHKGTGITGYEALEDLESKYGKLPETVQQETGSGGLHILFKHHEGISNKGNIFPSIDVRGDGGYIVVSPSVHETGNKYEWDAEYHPLFHEIAEAPRWLLSKITSNNSNRKHKVTPSSHWVNLFNNTSEGNRNNAAAQLAGHLFRKYVDPLLVIQILHLWNSYKVNPPLDEDELNTVINSIAAKELKRRRRRR